MEGIMRWDEEFLKKIIPEGRYVLNFVRRWF